MESFFEFNSDKVENIPRILRFSTRFYYIYSILLNLTIQAVVHFNIRMNLGYFAFPIMIQAGLLLYTFQTYRKFFILSSAIRNKFLLRLGFFFWLLLILFLGIEQIIHVPLLLGGLAFVLTGNENFATFDSNTYFWFINIFSFILAILGELLLRKIISTEKN